MTDIISTSWDCWRELESAGGLDTTRYDAELVQQISESLGLDQNRSLRGELRRRMVSVEDFLSAFFTAIRPYSDMMKDLLVFFERAGAIRSSTGNLQIEFDFGKKIPGLEFDLRSFRLWQQVFTTTSTGSDDERYWNHDYLLSLCQVLQEGSQRSNSGIARDPSDERARSWLNTYDHERVWPSWPLRSPEVDATEFSTTLANCWQTWTRIVSASRNIGVSRASLDVYQWESRGEDTRGWSHPWLLKLLDRVDWCGRVARAAYQIADNSDIWESLGTQLDDLLSKVPRRQMSKEARVEAFRELLSLPLWQRRHDLYGAWVGTQIASALGEGVTILSRAGTLRYAFSGTHLASLRLAQAATLHLWSELRSSLISPQGKGRKAGIQPDYSLQLEPVTYSESSRLVVECKQYLKAATRSFADALADYSHGRPEAAIVLVNYGPANERILDNVPADVRNRCHIIGDFRPGRPKSLAKFFEIVTDVLSLDENHNTPCELTITETSDQQTSAQSLESSVAPAGTVADSLALVLRWDAQPCDLDLHVWVLNTEQTWTEISYREKGNATAPPWGFLDRDCTDGRGPETVVVNTPTRIRCAVNNFSKELGLAKSGASIQVLCNWMELTLSCPKEGDGDWWDVFEIDMLQKTILVRTELRGESRWAEE